MYTGENGARLIVQLHRVYDQTNQFYCIVYFAALYIQICKQFGCSSRYRFQNTQIIIPSIFVRSLYIPVPLTYSLSIIIFFLFDSVKIDFLALFSPSHPFFSHIRLSILNVYAAKENIVRLCVK